MPEPSNLLEVRNLKKHFPVTQGILKRVVGHIRAVDGIDLRLAQGEALGLVGESGCGKTTAGRTILRLIEPSHGEILFRSGETAGPGGEGLIDVASASPKVLKRLRREMQIVYQDPYSSLHGRMSVGAIVGEPLRVNGIGGPSEREERVRYLLAAVGLDPDHARRYPHQFSGGQRQRIAIARALSLSPKLIVADEPVSALDVSVQAQVLELLKSLKQDFRLSYLFITHDLAVVKYISTRIAVMYLGRIVEEAPTDQLFSDPKHPYTEALISAVPVPDPDHRTRRVILRGDVPNPLTPPPGCHFHPRCRYAKRSCGEEDPELRPIGKGRSVRCHLAEHLALRPL